MKYQAIIFDLDGVICHTDEYHYLAWKQLADQLGIYFDKTINNRLRGISRMESLEIILEQWQGDPFNEEQKERLASQKNELYKELLKNMSPRDLSKEVRTTLDKLKERGFLLAIGSSSRNARLILSQISLGHYFDAVVDGNNIMKSKPDPEVFIKAADYMKQAPVDCLVVEDAKAGIDAAAAAGMECAAIGDAITYEKATYHLNSFNDLLTICS